MNPILTKPKRKKVAYHLAKFGLRDIRIIRHLLMRFPLFHCENQVINICWGFKLKAMDNLGCMTFLKNHIVHVIGCYDNMP